MLSARLNAFDDASSKVARQPRRSESAPALTESEDNQNTKQEASSSNQPTPPERDLHHRAVADEILAVSPSATSLPSYPDEWASARSVIGTAIEAEMMDEEEEREMGEAMFPLFRRMDFGGQNGEGHAEDVFSLEELQAQARAVKEAQQQQQQQQAKRKPSQRMSVTFEAVAGFGRNVKRRVSSIFSRTNSNERKDSRWVNLETGKQEQVARRESTKLTKKKASSSGPTPSRWSSKKTPGQNNPYPCRNGFVGRRQQKAESRRTSAHWTPYSSATVSMKGIYDYELGDPVTPRSMIGAVTSDAGMASLTRQATPPERHVQVTVTAVADENVFPQEKVSSGERTPTKSRPTGVSMVESGSALAHHLNHALSLGRFNSERIEQRFAGAEKELESPFDDDQDTAVESPATADLVFHSAEGLSDEQYQYMQSWFNDRSSRYPREPRPSASTVDQEPNASSSFGAHFAHIACVMGTSMQQAPLML